MDSKLIILVFFIFLSFAVALFAGLPLQIADLMQTGSESSRVLWELRVPRVVFVFFIGAVLAVVGAVYQILFYNPLAEPYLLGISSAAILGIAVAEAFFGMAVPSLGAQAVGMICAGIATVFLLLLFFTRAQVEVERIALFGLGLSFVLSSLLFLLLSYRFQYLGSGSLRWLFGQIPWIGLESALKFSVISTLAMFLLIATARWLDALSFGDEVARSLGASPRKIRIILLGLTSCLMAWLVSFTGAIGFVGLIVPHLVKLIYQPHTARRLLVLCIALGGGFLLISDAVSRSLLPPMEFPVGIITALVGGPLFLGLLWKR